MLKSLSVLFTIISFQMAYSWEYIGSVGSGSGENLEIGSNGNIYVADYDAGLSGANILIRVKIYNGTTWEELSNAASSSGGTINSSIDLEVVGSDVYVGYAEFKNSAFLLTVKKYVNNVWTQVGTNLQMGSSSNFDLVVDPDGVCYALHGGTNSLDNAKINKLVNNAWVTTSIPDANGVVFSDKGSYFDANKDLIFPKSKTTFAGGKLVAEIKVQKFSGGSFTGIGNTFSSSILGVYLRASALADGTTKLTVSDATNTAFFTLNSNIWAEDVSQTSISASFGAVLGGDSKWYYTNNKKIFKEGGSSEIYNITTIGIIISDLKFYSGHLYAVLNNGVIKQSLSALALANDNLSLKNEFSAYPNPVQDKLFINENFLQSNYAILNAIGNEVQNGVLSEKGLDISQLNSGLYHLQVSKNGSNHKTKFIKE